VATLVEELVRAGERVHEVRRDVPTLENIYLSAMAGVSSKDASP
jgi:hypothetical protein